MAKKFDLNLFDIILNYLWPNYRYLVKHKLSNRCERCTLNDKFTIIQNGLCQVCSTQSNENSQEIDPSKQEENRYLFDKLLVESQGKGKKKYDAAIFFSGGKDSTYMLYRIATHYKKLRLLAITIDNGFRSQDAIKNTAYLCNYFKIDHLNYSVYEIYKKMYRFGFSNFSHEGFVLTDIIDGELFVDIGKSLAADMSIPLLILGCTPEQIDMIHRVCDEYDRFNRDSFFLDDSKMVKREYFNQIRLDKVLTEEDLGYLWDSNHYKKSDIPLIVMPFQAWGYDKDKIIQELASLDLKCNFSSTITNDTYVTLGVYLDYTILGYSTFEPEFASQVRAGLSDRKKNLYLWEFVEYMTTIHPHLFTKSNEFTMAIDKLGYSMDDINHIIEQAKIALAPRL